jgi:hypothetical protein
MGTIALVSAGYYNVSSLERNLYHFKEVFPCKLLLCTVDPTTTYNYVRQGHGPTSDRLVMATLSTATRPADVVITWYKIDYHVVQDYLKYRLNASHLEAIHQNETVADSR